MINYGIIIQARSGSKRFPNKIFKRVGRSTIIEHVIDRVLKVKFKKEIIIATTRNKNDKKILNIAKKKGCNIFFGSEKNVLKRIYSAAKFFNAKNIMRISADSPFIDPLILNKSFSLFTSGKYDIVTNLFPPTFPKGMSVELMNFKTLEKAFKFAKTNNDKEHVTKYIYKNYKNFKIRNIRRKNSLRKYNFALDTKSDLNRINDFYQKLKKKKILKNFNLNHLLQLY